MAVLYDTSFSGADESPISTPWVAPTGSPGAINKVSNLVRNNAASTDASVYDNGSTYPDDQWAEITLSVAGTSPSPCVRMTAGGNFYVISNWDANTIRLYKVTAYSFAELAQSAAGITYSNGDVLYMEAQGDGTSTTIIVKQNGTTRITYTDSTSPHTGGKAGIHGYETTYRISRFRGGDFGASTASDQEGARFGNDDGAEAAHTWYAAQDTNITAPAGQTQTVNLIVNATGALGAKTFKLQYRRVGDADWRDMPVQ